MALLFMTSFDHWTGSATVPASNMMYRRFNVPVTAFFLKDTSFIELGTGRCGTNSLVVTNLAPGSFIGTGPHVTLNPATTTTGIVGAAVRQRSFANTHGIFGITSGGTQCANTQLWLNTNTDGTLSLVSGTCSNNIGWGSVVGTSSFAVHQDVYYFIELVFTVGNSGSATVYVNGNSVLSVSGQNFNFAATGNWNGVSLGGIPANTTGDTIKYDDLYILDTSGPAPLNARVGDVKIAVRPPQATATAPGSVQGFTAVPGPDHGGMVRELPTPDDDVTYLKGQSAGTTETLKYPVLDISSGTVYAVQVVPCVRKDDSGFKQMDGVARVSGVNYTTGLPQSISLTDYAFYAFIFSLNPATAAAWAVADVNAAEFGVTVQT